MEIRENHQCAMVVVNFNNPYSAWRGYSFSRSPHLVMKRWLQSGGSGILPFTGRFLRGKSDNHPPFQLKLIDTPSH